MEDPVQGSPGEEGSSRSWHSRIPAGCIIYYSGHSFRIGAASSAAAAGVPNHLIKAMGRWNSEAYLLYMKTPPETLASISRALAV